MPPLVQAAFLGVVQGLTEFLPVSSSAHLILARMFFGFDSDGSVSRSTSRPISARCSRSWRTSVAICVRSSCPSRICSAGPAVGGPARADRSPGRPCRGGGRTADLAPRGRHDPGSRARVLRPGRNRAAVADAGRRRRPLAAGALAFLAAERVGSKRRNEESLTGAEAFWIGCAQAAAALVPGISRSGATITVALFFGLRRAEAARFTFLLGIPAILGAAVLEFPDMLEQGLRGTAPLMPFGIVRPSSPRAVVGYSGEILHPLPREAFAGRLRLVPARGSPAEWWCGLQWLRRSFIAGFFVTVPLFVSVAAFIWLAGVVDDLTGAVLSMHAGRRSRALGPWHPDHRRRDSCRVGAVATNVFGKRFLQRAEVLLLKVPVFRTIYAPVKQLIVAFSPDNEFGFKRVVMLEDKRGSCSAS